MSTIVMVKKIYDRIIFYCSFIATICVVLIMFSNVLDAVLRWLDIPIYGVFELNGLLVGMMIFLGLAYTQKQKKHISVSLLHGKVPPRVRHIVLLITSLLGVVFFAWLTYLFGLRTYEAFVAGEVIPGIVKISIVPLKFAMVLGIGLLTIQQILDVVAEFKAMTSKDATEPTDEMDILVKGAKAE